METVKTGEFHYALGYISALLNDPESWKQHDNIIQYVTQLEDALDSADEEDFFGTEGWRHHILGED